MGLNYLDYFNTNQLKKVDELQRTIDFYMRWEVNGDEFENEQDFEDAVREKLENSGFDVLDKQNVKNTQEVVRGLFSENVKAQIPDISIQCAEGLVFLELKFRNTPANYEADIDKVNNYLEKGECAAAGVLFMDTTRYEGWKLCSKGRQDTYYYYWDLE